jgi:hypothetical protein
MDVSGFLSVYFSDWVGWMSGLCSVGLTVWGFARPKNDPKKPFIIVAIIVAFLIAPIHVWTNEHRAKEKLQAALDDKTPKLALLIHGVGTGHDPQRNGVVSVLASIELTNKGEPSMADQWTVDVITSTGRVLRGRLVYMSPKASITLEGITSGPPSFATDPIEEKAMEKPLTSGTKLNGNINAIFPDATLDEIRTPGGKVVVTCRDILDKEAKAEFKITTERAHNWGIFPGMTPPETK